MLQCIMLNFYDHYVKLVLCNNLAMLNIDNVLV